jgi:hypothetical protein
MAQHVAAHIEAAEAATGAQKAKAERACAGAILEIWKHRAELPLSARPFAGLERIMATLSALDPEEPNAFYRPDLLSQVNPGPDGEDDPARHWLRGALSIDQAARLLIDHCVTQAAVIAASTDMTWVRAAAEAELESGPDSVVTVMLANKARLSWERDHERRTLTDRIDRLKRFAAFADALEADYWKRLEALDSPAPEEEAEDE